MWSWAGFAERRNRGPEVRHAGRITGHDLAVENGRSGRQLAEHLTQQRKASAEPIAVAAVEFDILAELMDLDAKAVELDLVLPIV
jgi:hypothetical protein